MHVGEDRRLVCVDGSWLGQVHCAPVKCGDPTRPFTRYHCPNGTDYGAECRFDCKTPALLNGTGGICSVLIFLVVRAKLHITLFFTNLLDLTREIHN